MDEAQLHAVVERVIAQEHLATDTAVALKARRAKWCQLLRNYQQFGHFSTGNHIQVLEGGDACFTEMLAALQKAQKRVWCESYIFDSSKVAKQVYEELLRAAQRGCDVILLIDYIGSFSFPSDWARTLREAGAEVVFFNAVLPANACVGPLSFRDHRKTMVCDDIGFCGGMNIHEEVGEAKFGTSRFYDVHAKLEGPCVADLAEVIRDSLRETGNRVHRNPIPPPAPLENGVYVQILQSNVRQGRRTLQHVFETAINAADDSIHLATAYFFPPGFLKRALLGVPARQVHLSLLLSGSSDFFPLPGDLLAQNHFLGSFLREVHSQRSRIAVGDFRDDDEGDAFAPRVHLYGARHMHAKYMTIDRVFSTIGSFNFDLYSARRNLEVGIAVFDHDLAVRLQEMHETKARYSKMSTLSDWTYHNPMVRVACAISYGCIRLSGGNLFDGLDCLHRRWLVRKAALTFLLEEQAAQFVATSMMWGLQ